MKATKMTSNYQPRCIGYKYKTFRKYCSLCGLSFAARTRKYLINYGDKFMTDVVCSKACRDQALWMAKSIIEEVKIRYTIRNKNGYHEEWETTFIPTKLSPMRGDASNE